jgi:hypothetical protein
MADDDVRLTSKTLANAVKELVKQMQAATSTVLKPTCTATPAAVAGNNGNGVCTASVLGAAGVQMDYVFAETVDIAVTSDAQNGATQGREPLSVAGDAAQADVMSWDWPKGSGTSGAMSAVDATQDATATGNLLTNSDFDAFTSNTPDNFAVAVGTPGTTVFASGSSDAFGGTGNALKITGNGSELTSLTQTFNVTSGGTNAALRPLTAYAVNCWMKKSSGLAAGVLAIQLIDGTNAVINDAAGTANTIPKTLSTLTTSYAAFNGYFRTPAVLPSTIKLRIILTTAATNGESAFLDHLALTPATQLYAGGPFAAVFSGPTKFITNDAFTITVANDAMTGTGSKWQKLAERLFGMRSLGLQLPSGASPTIAESLVA